MSTCETCISPSARCLYQWVDLRLRASLSDSNNIQFNKIDVSRPTNTHRGVKTL